jgi:hypothetical protein
VIAGNVGLTQKDLKTKAAALQAEESATRAQLKADEESTKQQFGAVNTEVTNVKGQVTKVSGQTGDRDRRPEQAQRTDRHEPRPVGAAQAPGRP